MDESPRPGRRVRAVASEVDEESDVAICVSCGADNPGEPRYCGTCGEEMGRVTSPDAHPDEVVDDELTTGGASATERARQSPDGPPTDEAGSEVDGG
jgi:ribosomal protein L40E